MHSTYIFGQRVDCLTQHQIVQKVLNSVVNGKRMIVFAMNTHILSELKADPQFQKKHVTYADVIFPDGVPIVWFSRVSRCRIPERVNGTELVEKVLSQPKLKIYLVGSTERVLRKMRFQYPTLCGHYAPPFGKKWTADVNKKILADINRYRPDVVMVGVSPLKQEKWIVEHASQIKAPVLMAVGSAFDILSGITPRAPGVMQKNGLEWLWRMWLEPVRLVPRYAWVSKTLLFLLFTSVTAQVKHRFRISG